MTIECKDLEWEFTKRGTGCLALGVQTGYAIDTRENGEVAWWHGMSPAFVVDSIQSAQAAANEHNKQQFQAIIDEWRKG